MSLAVRALKRGPRGTVIAQPTFTLTLPPAPPRAIGSAWSDAVSVGNLPLLYVIAWRARRRPGALMKHFTGDHFIVGKRHSHFIGISTGPVAVRLAGMATAVMNVNVTS